MRHRSDDQAVPARIVIDGRQLRADIQPVVEAGIHRLRLVSGPSIIVERNDEDPVIVIAPMSMPPLASIAMGAMFPVDIAE